MIIEYVCICHIYIYIYTFLSYKNIYVDIVTNIFLLDTMQKKISGRGKLPKFEMIYDRKNKYLLSVTISIEHNSLQITTKNHGKIHQWVSLSGLPCNVKVNM